MYIFSEEFLNNIVELASGPGRFRFIVQPLVALLLGIRDGVHDAKIGAPPFLLSLIFRPKKRRELWKSGKATLLAPFLIAIVLDSVFQLLILGRWHPGGALAVGVLLVGLPYAVIRGATNRVVCRKSGRKGGDGIQ